ncbi:MAG: tetratricopeptide repeat protein, partial [Planctomycetes bacterium]|nr:tetratricopeptide repeat protein [Planctomycetota bacterium]
MGDLSGAVEDFTKSIVLDPKFTDTYVNKANALLRLEQNQPALQVLARALEIDPKNRRVLRLRMHIFARMSECDRSLADSARVLELYPEDADTRLERASLLAEVNRVEEAKQELDRVRPLVSNDNDRSRYQMTLGFIAEAEKDYPKAIEYLSSALKIAQDGEFESKKTQESAILVSLEKRSRLYLNTLDFGKGLADAEAMVAIRPSAFNWSVVAQFACFLGKNDRAIEAYTEALRIKPDNALSHTGLALVYKERGEYEKAIESAKHALRLKSSDGASAWLVIIDCYGRLGRSDEILKSWERAVEEFPDSILLIQGYLRQLSLRKLHAKLGQELKYYRKHFAEREVPNEFQSLLEMYQAELHEQRGETDQAAKCYEKALEINPNNYPAAVGYGSMKTNYGDPAGGLAILDKVVKALEGLESYDADQRHAFGNALLNRGSSFSALGRVEEALADFARAEALEGFELFAAEQRATLLLGRGRIDEAMAETRQVLKTNPSSAVASNILGICHYQRQEYADALKCFEQYIKVQPWDANGYMNKGNALRGLDRIDEALVAYYQTININFRVQGAHTYIGHIYLQRQEYEKAKEKYEDAIKARPDLAEPYFGLALYYIRTGKVEEAIKTLEVASKKTVAPFLARTMQQQWNIMQLALRVRPMLDKTPSDFMEHYKKGMALLFWFEVNDLTRFAKAENELNACIKLMEGKEPSEQEVRVIGTLADHLRSGLTEFKLYERLLRVSLKVLEFKIHEKRRAALA